MLPNPAVKKIGLMTLTCAYSPERQARVDATSLPQRERDVGCLDVIYLAPTHTRNISASRRPGQVVIKTPKPRA